MTFESEDVRGKYHELSAQRQLEYAELEIYLSRSQKCLHIVDVFKTENDRLEVLIRINQKL